MQTFSTTQAFFLAMSLNSDVQKRAQAELDVVIGPHRLPDQADRASLPYVSAVLKESLRWHNVAPFGVPHCNAEDIEYRGYFIPKGTTFIANTWHVLLPSPLWKSYPPAILQGLHARSGSIPGARPLPTGPLHA